MIHTYKKHPFLTVEKGFLPVGQMKLGMHVVEADGQVGMVSGWKVVASVQTMYNLEVAQDHTFVVGVGMWVVHNCDKITSSFPGDYLAKDAPNVVSPGTNSLQGVHMGSSGVPEPWLASYDKYGRIIGRTDIEGGLKGVKDPIHYHEYGSAPGSNMGNGRGDPQWLKDWGSTSDHVPGVFDPFNP